MDTDAAKRDARRARLRYVNDDEPGIRRTGHGPFRYTDPNGKRLTNKRELARIRSLAIPPAWTDVWICKTSNGHIQATGRDARRRKQYRYHDDWRATRDANKYDRMIAFGKAVGKIRKAAQRDLKRKGLPKEKVVATILHLLESTSIRVGNEEYARANRSFGLTTLRNRHVEVKRGKLTFRFKGKSGKDHLVDVNDSKIAKIVRKCEELPGQRLFEYVDNEGGVHTIESTDVNDYIRAASGADFTAKDFRTLTATLLAAHYLRSVERAESETALRKTVNTMIRAVASRLGNTVSVCRKSYIHPFVIESFLKPGQAKHTASQRAIARLLLTHELPEIADLDSAAE